MDPTAAVREIREIVTGWENCPGRATEREVDRLVDLWQGLDQWMSKGGFLPEQWRRRS